MTKEDRASSDLTAAIHSRQRAWPAAAPLNEAELQAALDGLLQEAKAISQRAKPLFESMPRPPEAEYDDEVPRSLYFGLYDAIFSFFEGDLDDLIESVEVRLAQTPESLLEDWLSAETTNSLKSFAMSRRVASWLDEQPEPESQTRCPT